jgi:hypothetical protein
VDLLDVNRLNAQDASQQSAQDVNQLNVKDVSQLNHLSVLRNGCLSDYRRQSRRHRNEIQSVRLNHNDRHHRQNGYRHHRSDHQDDHRHRHQSWALLVAQDRQSLTLRYLVV